MRLEDLIGRRLGRYEIVDVLGRGGMAAVYRAHDTLLRRDVALKVLYPQYTGDTALVERFQREAVLAAGLDHPNILPIYDVGEADGLVYIAMRLLSGRSFADVLRRRGALPPDQLVPIVEQIASALDYAHARQIVHRDIKPANILIEGLADAAPPAVGIHAVLTDFGIAKSLDPAATGLTVTGVLIGTPEYMAPEQIRGGRKVDGRTDVYALGVLVYRALTGRRPFEGGTQEVLIGHLQGGAPDPSAIEPALPRALDPVIRKALAVDPEQRYRSAGEFAQALRAAAGMEPPTPPPALRRESDGRAVVPRVAVADMGRHEAATALQSTRKGDAAPPYARPARERAVAPPVYHPDRPAPPALRSGAAIVALVVLLVLAIGGGSLYAFGIMAGGRGGGSGAVLPTTAAPAATATPPEPTPTREQPSATAAPSPTSAPATSAPPATRAPKPTRRPTATPTATPAPASTPSPTSTPAITPTHCAGPLAGGFGKLWEQNDAVRTGLGCSLEIEDGGPKTSTEQQFESGSMFYFQPRELIYVLVGVDSGSWTSFGKSDLQDIPTPAPDDPLPCPAAQHGGFALVWSSQPDVREALGCSLTTEPALFEGAYQPFQHGAMLYSQLGLGRGKTIYVLFDNKTFERFDDPNQ